MLGYHHPVGTDIPLRSRHPQEADTYQKQTPPRGDTPQEQTPPEADTPLPQKQTPLEADTPQEQTPLWEADSGIRSTSGWYASYWNAFLFKFKKE